MLKKMNNSYIVGDRDSINTVHDEQINDRHCPSCKEFGTLNVSGMDLCQCANCYEEFVISKLDD